MKCQHCGINFDDSERACPMCGARAGSRGRLGAGPARAVRARGTAPERESYADYVSAKARPAAKRARASARPIRERKKGRGGRVVLIAVILIVLLNLIPTILSAAPAIWESLSSPFDSLNGSAVTYADPYEEDLRYVPGETYPYDSEDYRYVYAALHDLTGPEAAGLLADGAVLTLSVEPGEAADYELTIEDGSGVYTETGYTWCSYNYPEEGLYGEDFPPEQYDSFLLSLYTEDFSYTGGDAVPERYAPGEYGGHWFVLYYARETGAVVLEDMDDTGLFQSERYLSLSTLEHG